MSILTKLQKGLEGLLKAVKGTDNILILPHNNPDPDAIASAVALQHLIEKLLEIKSNIVYQGIIGRAENKALVNFLGRPLRRVSKMNFDESKTFALVDTQPGAGNNSLPANSSVAIVIDHHSMQEATRKADFFEVREDVGATSTILTDYIKSADIELPPLLATALFYGIKTDTRGLGSNDTSPADVAAYSYLQACLNVDLLAKIEQAQVPLNYFKSFEAALRAAKIYDNVVISYLGSMDYPDLTAEIADLLLRLEKSQWVICIGFYKDEMILSVRARSRRRSVIKLIQSIVLDEGTCGGHGTVAGGQIILNDQDPEQLANILSHRALEYFNIPADSIGQPLV